MSRNSTNLPTELSQIVTLISDLVRYIKIVEDITSPDNSWTKEARKEALLLKSSPNNPEFDTEIYRSLEVSFGKIKELLANYIRVTNELVENSDVSNVTANDSKQQTCAKLNGTILAEISVAVKSITSISQKKSLRSRRSLTDLRSGHTLTLKRMKPSAPKKAILNFDSEGSELVSEVDYSYSRSIRNEVQIGERLPPVVSQTNLFSVDPETDTMVVPLLTDLQDIYSSEFFPSTHTNYIGSNDSKSHSIISVLKIPILEHPEVGNVVHLGSSYPALLTDKTGQRKFTINSFALPCYEEIKDISVAIQQFLNERSPDFEWSRITDPEFPTDLLQIEKKHTRKITAMKVAVLYVQEGQTDLMEIFKNQPPSDSPFYQMMNALGDVISLLGWTKYRGDFNPDSTQKSYYTSWRDELEIMFHIAPWMDSESHRRLIGNDICVLVFYDSPLSSFNPAPLDGLGTVPQVFAVVQPYKQLFRFGSFNRSNLKSFLPDSPPRDYLLSAADLKDYLFIKLHNGLAMAWSCPPMNRLFCTPRGATIDELAAKYQTKKPEKTKMKLGIKKPKRSEIRGLIVTVIRGSNLIAKDSSGTSDPFVQLIAGSNKAKTPIKMKTLQPVWNCEIALNIDDKVSTLDLICYDWDRFSSDTYMGEVNIPISAIEENVSKWYPLISKTSQIVSGSIELQIRFKSKTEKKGVSDKQRQKEKRKGESSEDKTNPKEKKKTENLATIEEKK